MGGTSVKFNMWLSITVKIKKKKKKENKKELHVRQSRVGISIFLFATFYILNKILVQINVIIYFFEFVQKHIFKKVIRNT